MAATLNIAFTMQEVEVQTDYDDGGLSATTGVPPRYSELRDIATIESKAAGKDILKIPDKADHHSPCPDLFSRGQNCKTEMQIVPPKLQS